MRKPIIILFSLIFAASCVADDNPSFTIKGSDGISVKAQVLDTFSSPWAMAFLPDGKGLVTEKAGALWVIDKEGKKLTRVDNIPSVTARGQGGLGDVIVHPDFDKNGIIYLSYVERDKQDDNLSGAVVDKFILKMTENTASVTGQQRVWQQSPKVTGNGHYSHRMVISPDGFLYITSGERQKFTPSQNMAMNLGKIIRINQDGTIPQDNPFAANGPVTDQIWSLGHRNVLGVDFDSDGNLWATEMGPKHGDEMNLIRRSANYGYPNVSEGDHYSGVKIPNHADIPVYQAPVVAWVPAISPAGFMIYKGELFSKWQGDAFLAGLSSIALVRVDIINAARSEAKEAARYEWNKRVREVEQNTQGEVFVLEDGDGGRLLKLTPMN